MPLTTKDFPMVPPYRPHQFPTTIVLKRGSHRLPSYGSCAMEVARLVAGYPWVPVSGRMDFPLSFCPVLSTALMFANDNLDDVERQKLLRYVVKMEGTAGGPDVETARAKAICDVVVYKYESIFPAEHNATQAIVWSTRKQRRVAVLESPPLKWAAPMADGARTIPVVAVSRDVYERDTSLTFRALDAAFAIGPQAAPVEFEQAIKRAESAINSYSSRALVKTYV